MWRCRYAAGVSPSTELNAREKRLGNGKARCGPDFDNLVWCAEHLHTPDIERSASRLYWYE